MESVEYMESSISPSTSSKSAELETKFFPSLEELKLYEMKSLKGWWKEVEVEASMGENDTSESASYGVARQQFSKLLELLIYDCPNLTMLPLCPNVESLTLVRTNETLSVLRMIATSSPSSTPSTSSTGPGLKLKKLIFDNTEDLMSLPNHCLQQLSKLEIFGDDNLESTNRLGDVYATLSSSLRTLEFWHCNKLRSIANGLEHLTALEQLDFINCQELDVLGDEQGMPWKALNTSLRSLTLRHLPKVVGLPRGLQHLANLRSLTLDELHELEELPEWISCFSSLEYLGLGSCPKLKSLSDAFRKLTSLDHLRISDCPALTRRCQGPHGSDYPKIQHIPLCDVDKHRRVYKSCTEMFQSLYTNWSTQ